jgi:hypothetical protein
MDKQMMDWNYQVMAVVERESFAMAKKITFDKILKVY